MKTLYLDCYSGISGDMTVGALLDAGGDFAALQAMVDSLGMDGVSLSCEKVVKHGITATQFKVLVAESVAQPHRHLRHVVEIIQGGTMPEAVKVAAIATFEILADAEAAVHGTSREKVHFHEVGAVDSIIDIVGAQFLLHQLDVESVYASHLHVGAGTVKCAHGVMPVPAPATARLLQDIPTYGGEVQGELVTPTGAALMRQWTKNFGGQPVMRVAALGYGSGEKDIPDRANVLRVMIGEVENARTEESVMVIETHLDDMNPEGLPPLQERLLEAGALEVFYTPILGKKGRPAQLLTLLCKEDQVDALAAVMFRHSTTFGLRMRREERIVLERRWEEVQTPWGAVSVKIGTYQGKECTTAPEFEACQALAKSAGVSLQEIYEAALAVSRKGEC